MIDNSFNFIKVYSNNNRLKACFSCYYNDYEKHGEKILGSIIPLDNNVDIYFNCSKEVKEDDRNIYLECLKEFDLFIFPITYSFLSNKSLSRDIDLMFTLKNNYPIIPIIMEPGLEGILSKRFGGSKILDKVVNFDNDGDYKNKLNKLFNEIIPLNDTQTSIDKLFSSSIYIINNIFDLKYVNKISKIIHESNANIAIYHRNNIIDNNQPNYIEESKIRKSSVVLLFISPNLINYSNNDLYELIELATTLSKPIVPIAVEDCDSHKIKQRIKNLPEIININKKDQLMNKINKYCKTTHIDQNPKNNYCLALAYLFSINCERNITYALELLESLASQKYLPAIKLLSTIYENGIFTDINYRKAINYRTKELKYIGNEVNEDLLISLSDLYYKNKDYYLARSYYIKCYKAVKNRLGENDLHTISIEHSLGKAYLKTNKLNKALSIFYKCYEKRKSLLSESHPDTLDSLLFLAITYNRLGQHEKSREMDEKVFEIMSKVYGKFNIKTLKTMDNLADDYFNLKDYKKSYEISNESYRIRKEKYGENDLETVSPLRNIARIHYVTGDYYKSIELNEQIYNILINLFDIYYPQAVDALSNISKNYAKLQEYKKSEQLSEQVLNIRKNMLGESHPDTLNSLKELADIYEKTGNHAGAVKLNEEYRRLHMSNKNNYSIFIAIGFILLVYVVLPIIVISFIISFF